MNFPTSFALTNRLAPLFALALLAIVVYGCDAATPVINRIEAGETSAARMFEFAEELRRGDRDIPSRSERNGERLINRFDWSGYIHDLIERFYPDSPYAALGQLRQAEAYFDEGDYDKAVPELEEFIIEHPGHPQIDYAYYLSAMSAFVQISTEGLDPGDTQIAIARFERLLQERPNSQYKGEAERRITAAETQLAATEVRLGLTLQRQGNFEGAISRYIRVVNDYDTTIYIEEALYRLVESYLSLGLRGEAETYGKLLGNNYPNGQWYRQAYGLLTGERQADAPGFLARLLGR